MRLLFDQAPVAIAILRGPNYVYEYANRDYLRMVQRTELVGHEYTQVFPELAGAPIIGILDHVYRTGEPFQTTELCIPVDFDGAGVRDHYFRFNLEPVRGPNQEIEGLMAVAVEITELAQAKRELATAETQLRTLVDSIPALAWTARADGWIDFYNQRWYDYTGTTPAQMEGWGWQSVHDPALLPAVLERWNTSIRTGQPFEMAFPLRGADGKFRWHLTRVNPLLDAQGRVIRWFGTNTDINTQVRGAQKLKESLAEERVGREQAERMVAFADMFAGILAHDLRNPLSATNMAAHVILKSSGENERITKPAQRIVASSQRMSRMIDQLLDFTRIRIGGGVALAVSPVDLEEVCRQVVAELNPANFQVESRGDIKGKWDEDRLYQLLSNLAGNAVKHGAGPVRFQLDGTQPDQVLATVSNAGEIPSEIHASLFDPFAKGPASKPGSEGLGLGLYISRQIAVAHGGNIDLHSNGGQTTFTLQLPRESLPGKVAVGAEKAES